MATRVLVTTPKAVLEQPPRERVLFTGITEHRFVQLIAARPAPVFLCYTPPISYAQNERPIMAGHRRQLLYDWREAAAR